MGKTNHVWTVIPSTQSTYVLYNIMSPLMREIIPTHLPHLFQFQGLPSHLPITMTYNYRLSVCLIAAMDSVEKTCRPEHLSWHIPVDLEVVTGLGH